MFKMISKSPSSPEILCLYLKWKYCQGRGVGCGGENIVQPWI